MTIPKVFISYSWTTPEYQERVIDFARELKQNRVDVKIDVWDLREGHDKYVFMEQMVTSEEIKKVIILVDKTYAEKADRRISGVGSETQIITGELYGKTQQDKFVVIVFDRDEKGNVHLPAYLSTRLYIDLSTEEKYSLYFNQVLRWIFDKPLRVAPPLGPAPSFLEEDEPVSQFTSSHAKRVTEAIRNQKPYALGAMNDYLDALWLNLEEFRIEKEGVDTDSIDIIEVTFNNIEKFTPIRNEFIQVMTNLSIHSYSDSHAHRIHGFFERCLVYFSRKEGTNRYNTLWFDQYKFIIRELFLYAIAIFLKNANFDYAAHLISTEYFVNDRIRHEVSGSGVTVFEYHLDVFEMKNRSLRRGYLSLRANEISRRCNGTGIELRHLQQADFILFLRADMIEDYSRWYPDTLVYTEYNNAALEIFQRCMSKAYFEKVKHLLGVESFEEFENFINQYNKEGGRKGPQWHAFIVSPRIFTGIDKMCKRP